MTGRLRQLQDTPAELATKRGTAFLRTCDLHRVLWASDQFLASRRGNCGKWFDPFLLSFLIFDETPHVAELFPTNKARRRMKSDRARSKGEGSCESLSPGTQ